MKHVTWHRKCWLLQPDKLKMTRLRLLYLVRLLDEDGVSLHINQHMNRAREWFALCQLRGRPIENWMWEKRGEEKGGGGEKRTESGDGVVVQTSPHTHTHTTTVTLQTSIQKVRIILLQCKWVVKAYLKITVFWVSRVFTLSAHPSVVIPSSVLVRSPLQPSSY